MFSCGDEKVLGMYCCTLFLLEPSIGSIRGSDEKLLLNTSYLGQVHMRFIFGHNNTRNSDKRITWYTGPDLVKEWALFWDTAALLMEGSYSHTTVALEVIQNIICVGKGHTLSLKLMTYLVQGYGIRHIYMRSIYKCHIP